MQARVRKHLGASSGLSFRAWERVRQALAARWAALEAQLAECYPAQPLRPSAAELREQLRAIG